LLATTIVRFRADESHLFWRTTVTLITASLVLLLLVAGVASTSSLATGAPIESRIPEPRDIAHPSGQGLASVLWMNGTLSSRVPLASMPRGGASLTSAGTTPAAIVRATLLLANHTLDAGNVVPENGTYPVSVAISPSAHELFIGCVGGIVVVVNTTSDRIINAVSTGSAVNSVAYDGANNEVYATNFYTNSVSFINASNDQLAGSFHVGTEPAGVTYDPLSKLVLVADYGSNNVSVINGSTNSVVRSFPVGSGPGTIAVDTANGHLFTSNAGDNVTIDDGATYASLGSVPAGPDPGDLAFAPSNGYVYVSDSLTNDVTAIDAMTGTAAYTIPVGTCPWGVAYDPFTKDVFVSDTSCSTSGNLSEISTVTQKVISTTPVGNYPFSVVDDPATGLLYTANELSTNVSIINASRARVVGTVGAGNQPTDLAYDSANHLVYVADEGGNDVTILNGTTGTELGSFGTGFAPFGIAYDTKTGVLFVTNSFSNNVTAVRAQSETSVGSIAVGINPQGIAFDPANGELYVANCGSNTISVINGSTLLLVATLGAGPCPREALYDPSNGRIYVTNAGPNYIEGAVDLNVTVVNGTTDRPDGSVTVGSAPWGETYDGINRTVVVSNVGSTNLSIINTTSDRAAGSIGNETSWATCLPAALSYDTFDNELFVACGLGYSEGNHLLAVEPWTGRIIGTVDVGLFPGGLLTDAVSGEVVVTNWGSGTVSILEPTTFPAPQFNLSLAETGLPAGTLWSASVNGTTNSSRSSLVSFTITNGRYEYLVQTLAGYAPSPSSGTAVVQNGTRIVPIHFLQLFGVRFVESGLPAGTAWSLTWNGTPFSIGSSSQALNALNGSYNYSITPPTGYGSALPNGTVRVQGSNVTLQVPFEALAGPGPSIESFQASPPRGVLGTTFSLRLTVRGGSAPLTYNYLGLPPGCVSSNSSVLTCVPTATGNFTIESDVQDAAQRYTEAFVSIQVLENTTSPRIGPGSGPGSLLGLPGSDGVLLILLLVATAVILLVYVRARKRAARAEEIAHKSRSG
jgi:YVTN family beta-propeller protein